MPVLSSEESAINSYQFSDVVFLYIHY